MAGGAVLFSAAIFDTETFAAIVTNVAGNGTAGATRISNEDIVFPLLRQVWLNIAFAIFNDIAWKHLAYAAGGFEDFERLADRGELPSAVSFVDVLGAWKKIAYGGSVEVYSGSEDLVKYEQRVAIRNLYRKIEAIEPLAIETALGTVRLSMPNLLTIASRVRDPLPGMVTFFQWRNNKYDVTSDEYFTDDTVRFEYMQEVLWPFWGQMPQAERDGMVFSDLSQLDGWRFTLAHQKPNYLR